MDYCSDFLLANLMAIPEPDLSNSEFNRFREIVDSANKNFKERVQRNSQSSQDRSSSLRSKTPQLNQDTRIMANNSVERLSRRIMPDDNYFHHEENGKPNKNNLTLDHTTQVDIVPRWYLSRRTTEGIKSNIEYTAERHKKNANHQQRSSQLVANLKGAHLLSDPAQKSSNYSIWELSKRLGVNPRFSKSSLNVEENSGLKVATRSAQIAQTVEKTLAAGSNLKRDLADSPTKKELFKHSQEAPDSRANFKQSIKKPPSVFDPSSRVVVNLKLSQANQKPPAKQSMIRSSTNVSSQAIALGASPKLQINPGSTTSGIKAPAGNHQLGLSPGLPSQISPTPQLVAAKSNAQFTRQSESPSINLNHPRTQTPHHARESIESLIRQKISVNPDHLKKLSDLEEFMALQTLQKKGMMLGSAHKTLSKDNSRIEALAAAKPDSAIPASTTKTREITSLLRTCTKDPSTSSTADKIQQLIKHSSHTAPGLAGLQPSPLLADAIKASKVQVALGVRPTATVGSSLIKTADIGANSAGEQAAARIASLLGVGKPLFAANGATRITPGSGSFRPAVHMPVSTAPHTPTVSGSGYTHKTDNQHSAKPFSALVKSRGSITRPADPTALSGGTVSMMSAHKAGLFLIRGASATAQGLGTRI